MKVLMSNIEPCLVHQDCTCIANRPTDVCRVHEIASSRWPFLDETQGCLHMWFLEESEYGEHTINNKKPFSVLLYASSSSAPHPQNSLLHPFIKIKCSRVTHVIPPRMVREGVSHLKFCKFTVRCLGPSLGYV